MPRSPAVQAVIDILRKERERRGLSQRALARQMGVTQSFIGAVEHHEDRNISLATLVRVAEALGGVVTVQFGVTDVQTAASASADAYTAPETPSTEEL